MAYEQGSFSDAHGSTGLLRRREQFSAKLWSVCHCTIVNRHSSCMRREDAARMVCLVVSIFLRMNTATHRLHLQDIVWLIYSECIMLEKWGIFKEATVYWTWSLDTRYSRWRYYQSGYFVKVMVDLFLCLPTLTFSYSPVSLELFSFTLRCNVFMKGFLPS